MPKFAAGVVRPQNEVYPEKKELYERLSQGQSPEALSSTCLNSRIEKQGCFVSTNERYAEQMARMAADHTCAA